MEDSESSNDVEKQESIEKKLYESALKIKWFTIWNSFIQNWKRQIKNKYKEKQQYILCIWRWIYSTRP